MAVPVQTPAKASTANGITTVFPYDFLILDEADLLVTGTLSGVESTYVLNVDYTVSGVGVQGGGNVTFTAAPTSGTVVLRQRNMAYKRDVDYQANGDLIAGELNPDQDAPIMMIQQLAEVLGRTPQLPGGGLTGVAFPAPGAGNYIRWNLLGTALEAVSAVVDAGNFLASGVGAVLRSIQAKLGDHIAAEDYGALGDGVNDDTAALNAALAAAVASKSGIVKLRQKTYGVLGSLVVPNGVSLIGDGGGQYPASAFATSANFKATPKTRLLALAGFPAATPVVDVNVTRGDQYAKHGVRLEGFMIDCDQVADMGLRWRGVKNSAIRDVIVYRPTTASTSIGVLFDTAQGAATGQTAAAGGASTITFQTALASPRDDRYNGATITTTGGTGSGQTRTVTDYVGSTKVATVDSAWSVVPDATTVFSITGECLEGNGSTQFNTIDALTVWLGNTGKACGIEFNGDGIHDTNQNIYTNLQVVHADGPGIRMVNGDTDYIERLTTYAFGNGWGCEMHGSNATSFEGFCRQQFFDGVLFGGASVGASSGTAQAGAGLTITLAASANETDDYYNTKFVEITGGTGIGQRRKIADYTGATKVALVSEAWTTNPDATSTYTVNGGGGVALFKGTYRTSRFHTFDNYETEGNGAGEIYAEDGGGYTRRSERDYDLTDADGFAVTLGSGNAFFTGTGSRFNFMRRVRGKPQEMASIREVVTGAEGSENGSLVFFTRKAGATPTEAVEIGDGIQIGGGSFCKKLLQATAALDFPSVAAQGSQALTITVTGAAVNDIVMIGLPSNGYAAGLAIKGHVSAVDTVTITAMNYTAAAIDPGSQSCRVAVMGF